MKRTSAERRAQKRKRKERLGRRRRDARILQSMSLIIVNRIGTLALQEIMSQGGPPFF